MTFLSSGRRLKILVKEGNCAGQLWPAQICKKLRWPVSVFMSPARSCDYLSSEAFLQGEIQLAVDEIID